VFCYADGMTAYLSKGRIRIFHFTEFAKPLTDVIKAEGLAAANDLQIDYVRKKNFRKEDTVKAVLKEHGTHPGLVWIDSARQQVVALGLKLKETGHHSRACRCGLQILPISARA
jgi:hypothetical protein